MSQRTGIFFDLISEYKDRGAKQAASSLGSLEGLAKKVGVAMAGAFAADKILAFGKSSVNAFLSEEKSTQQLNVAFKNLGLQIQSLSAQATIKQFMKLYGVQDDLLIPAMTTLTRVTKNAATAQDILQTALDVSAGTGKDLGEVTNALAKAYGGNTTALVRLGAGLTKADVQGKSFAQVQQQLNNIFKGSASAAADTYAGKIARLKVGFEEMKQSIGEGLVNAFAGVGGAGGSIDQAINKLNTFGLAWQTVITNLSVGKFGLGKVFDFIQQRLAEDLNLITTGTAKSYEELAGDAYAQKLRANTKALEGYYKNLNDQNKVNQKFVAQDLANQKALTAQKSQQLALAKAKSILDIAGKTLDVQQAEVVAAMMNASLSENEILRLKLKQALMNDNAAAAGQLTQQLIAAQIASLQLSQMNPFGLMNSGILTAIQSLRDLAAALQALQVPAVNVASAISVASGTYYQSSTGLKSTDLGAGTFSQYYNGLSGGLYGSIPALPSAQTASTNVTVNVQGSVTTQQDLVAAITQGIYNNQASGIPINYSTAY